MGSEGWGGWQWGQRVGGNAAGSCWGILRDPSLLRGCPRCPTLLPPPRQRWARPDGPALNSRGGAGRGVVAPPPFGCCLKMAPCRGAAGLGGKRGCVLLMGSGPRSPPARQRGVASPTPWAQLRTVTPPHSSPPQLPALRFLFFVIQWIRFKYNNNNNAQPRFLPSPPLHLVPFVCERLRGERPPLAGGGGGGVQCRGSQRSAQSSSCCCCGWGRD